jgi:capsular polysaccharide biosynthesis protein
MACIRAVRSPQGSTDDLVKQQAAVPRKHMPIIQVNQHSSRQTSLKPGIECARLPRAAVRARRNRSFVYALIIVFVSSIDVRLLIDTASVPQDRLN